MIRPKKAPFSGCKIDANKTQGQIDKLLQDFGCDAIQWTKEFDINKIELRFIAEADIGGGRRKIGVKLTPPLFMEKRRTWDKTKGKNIVSEEPNFAQSMRVMFWYLKAKLTAVAYGIRPFEEEFLSEIIVPTEHGERRLVELLKEKSPAMLGLVERAPIQLERTEAHRN